MVNESLSNPLAVSCEAIVVVAVTDPIVSVNTTPAV